MKRKSKDDGTKLTLRCPRCGKIVGDGQAYIKHVKDVHYHLEGILYAKANADLEKLKRWNEGQSKERPDA